MTLLGDFLSCLASITDPELDSPELLPSRLARAVGQMLSLEGAGISVTDTLRVPIGSSSLTAALAERIQVTLGDGPCLSALSVDSTVAVDEAEMARRWPVFAELLTSQTPIRSVASVPLRSVRGAMDLYSSDPDGASALDVMMLDELGEHVDWQLAHVTDIVVDGVTMPLWLSAPAATTRMVVWQAVGVTTVAQGLSSSDALAVLRAAAYSRGVDLDTLASEVVSKRLDADASRDD